MDSHKFSKFRAEITLQILNLFKKVGSSLLWFLEKAGKVLRYFLFLILKLILLFCSPFYLRIKKTAQKIFSGLHYEGGFFSLFSQPKVVPLYLIFIFIFIIFEGNTPFRGEKYVEAFSLPPANAELVSKSDFKIAAAEEAFLKPNIAFDKEFIPTRTEIEKYVVEEEDTISFIAENFGVSVNTLLWENKLTSRSIIRPGQVLRILPISGVSHKVKQGENVEKIARLYRASTEDIIKFNDLADEPLKIGEEIIIPEGKVPPPPVIPRVLRRFAQDKTWLSELGERTREGSNCRNFSPGYCTYYVAQKYCILWGGHAKSWFANARKMGYPTGNEPRMGAIISLSETWYGHVAIVIEVNENSIIISEMNHLGRWRVNKREVKINDPRINGYIYMQ